MVDDFNPDDFGALVEWLRVGTKKGSARDLQARRMLARMLRSSEPLDQGTRLILADAVDPDGEGGLHLCLKRKRGRRRQFNKRRIAAFIYQRTKAGVSVESAVKEAEQKFAVGSSTAYSAWSEWGPRIERNQKELGRI